MQGLMCMEFRAPIQGGEIAFDLTYSEIIGEVLRADKTGIVLRATTPAPLGGCLQAQESDCTTDYPTG